MSAQCVVMFCEGLLNLFAPRVVFEIREKLWAFVEVAIQLWPGIFLRENRERADQGARLARRSRVSGGGSMEACESASGVASVGNAQKGCPGMCFFIEIYARRERVDFVGPFGSR